MQNWAAFRLGHGGAVRGMITAQTPMKGVEPTMRKGSYSEELVKNVDDTVNLVTPIASLV